MSPRAAWRLEALGFEQVADYVGGKADWLGHGLPREGTTNGVLYTGELVDREPPTCGLSATAGDVTAQLSAVRYGFCLVVNEQRVLLGRVRQRALAVADENTSVEAVMEPGPSTVRPNTPARDLTERLPQRDLQTAIVTATDGCLIGVLHRADVERELGR
ncbi:MAG: CBS domain-containing protein [Actinomycetota bacterium]|nr:CBS domain-containing protein [Actinomycetota bacterium]